MKKFSFFLFSLISVAMAAQVTTIPTFVEIGYKGEITIVFNPNEGNGGMKDATKCYAHTGVTVNGNTWQHAPSWRDGQHEMTKNADGNWELLITPDVNTYYGCTETEVVTGLSFVFNDGPNGSLEGKDESGGDIFVDFIEHGFFAKIQSPAANSLFQAGEDIVFKGAANETCNLTLFVNGEKKQEATDATELEYTFTLDEAGDYQLLFSATNGEDTVQDSIMLTVMNQTAEAARPEGIDMGIYYDEADNTKVTLSTYAGSKTEPAKAVFVVGDMNNWQLSTEYQMKRDGFYFWLELTDLEPQKEYAFQYYVVRADGVMKKISDLYSTKLLHPDDKYEPKKADPTLMDYPKAGDSYVTVIQTDKPAFNWSEATLNFRRPDKHNLIIYELWIYDYTADRNLHGLMKRLDYLENLGVNAIELMPVCEFDGNYNWGYSPNHYFAPDKAYGSETDLKNFIDECHKRGMAVILDMVFNHATGLNPMNKIYPYGNDLQYNPWFCTEVPHDDNVYEHWNHDFEPAKKMFTRALNYWIQEYKVDGYRMDLSHGLCGCGTKSSYDYSLLMDNLSHYYNEGVLAVADIEKNGEPYFILEHWGPNMSSQRPKLINQGMLCWQNTNNAYSQTAMGWLKDGDSFTDANKDGYVSYCESHDEERNFYKAKEYGYSYIKESEEWRLMRVPQNIAFNVLLNGPHMIWQYNELGYDYSINSTKGSTKITNDNRTSVKEQVETLGWLNEGIRMQQYQKVAQVVQLRTRILPELFAGDPLKVAVGSGKAVRTILWGNETDSVLVVGNFSADEVQAYTLPDGTWYDYLNNREQSNHILLMMPGSLYIFTHQHHDLPQVPSYYDLASAVEDIISFDDARPYTKKILREGQIVILLPDGREYTPLGVRIK